MLEVKPRTAALSGPPEGVTIAEAVRRTGVSAHTLLATTSARGWSSHQLTARWAAARRYRAEDLKWIKICTSLRATGMPIKDIRRYAQLVAAGPGNEQDRLALMEEHRAAVLARLAEVQENLKVIDHKIDVYRGRLEAGDADQLWAPRRPVRGSA